MESPSVDQKILSMIRDSSMKENGFRLLTKTYGERLYWHIRRVVIGHDDAEDVLQETFIQIFTKSDSFKGNAEQLAAWIYRIALNEALMHLRQQTHFFQSIDDVNPILISKLQAEDTQDGNKAERLLQEALLQLPTVQRMTFNMRYYDGMSYQQMSEVTGKSIGTLKTNFHYATERIKVYIKEHNE